MRETEMLSMGISAEMPAPMSQKTPKGSMWVTVASMMHPGVRVEMTKSVPPEHLYHGTATRFLPAILKEGLKPMTRQFVHISPDYDTAVKVGKRHGKPVVLVIRAADFVADGHELFLSANGVWQAKEVPKEYFTVKYIGC